MAETKWWFIISVYYMKLKGDTPRPWPSWKASLMTWYLSKDLNECGYVGADFSGQMQQQNKPEVRLYFGFLGDSKEAGVEKQSEEWPGCREKSGLERESQEQMRWCPVSRGDSQVLLQMWWQLTRQFWTEQWWNQIYVFNTQIWLLQKEKTIKGRETAARLMEATAFL